MQPTGFLRSAASASTSGPARPISRFTECTLRSGRSRIRARASRIAAARRKAGAPLAEAGYFLTVIFPHHQMKIMDYNRVMAGLNGMDAARFLQRISEDFSVQASSMPVKPAKSGK